VYGRQRHVRRHSALGWAGTRQPDQRKASAHALLWTDVPAWTVSKRRPSRQLQCERPAMATPMDEDDVPLALRQAAKRPAPVETPTAPSAAAAAVADDVPLAQRVAAVVKRPKTEGGAANGTKPPVDDDDDDLPLAERLKKVGGAAPPAPTPMVAVKKEASSPTKALAPAKFAAATPKVPAAHAPKVEDDDDDDVPLVRADWAVANAVRDGSKRLT